MFHHLQENFQNYLSCFSDKTKAEDFFQLTSKELMAIAHGKNEIDLSTLEKFSELTHILIEDLINETQPIERFESAFKQGRTSLPDFYKPTKEAFASMKTIKNFQNTIRELKGERLLNLYRKKLGIKSYHIENEYDSISPKLVMDYISLISHTNSFDLFSYIGLKSFDVHSKNEIGRSFRNSLFSPELVFQYLLEEVISESYDNLFNYRIKNLADSKISIEITPKQEAHSHLQLPLIGNKNLCAFKKGHFLSFSKYNPQYHYHLDEHDCLYSGGDACKIDIRWALKNHATREDNSSFLDFNKFERLK